MRLVVVLAFLAGCQTPSGTVDGGGDLGPPDLMPLKENLKAVFSMPASSNANTAIFQTFTPVSAVDPYMGTGKKVRFQAASDPQSTRLLNVVIYAMTPLASGQTFTVITQAAGDACATTSCLGQVWVTYAENPSGTPADGSTWNATSGTLTLDQVSGNLITLSTGALPMATTPSGIFTNHGTGTFNLTVSGHQTVTGL
jgi:hypothetical protein